MWYLLRYRLSKSLPTMFYLHGMFRPLFFHGDGAFQRDTACTADLAREASLSSKDVVWSLIDMGSVPDEPPHMLWAGRYVFPIQTTSPNKTKVKGWMKVI